jgi:hypothetical protein
MVVFLGATLGGCDSKDSTAGAPTISGSPAQAVTVGSNYTFNPTVHAAAGSALTFNISNKPAWATFNSATGALVGTPATNDVGMDPQIQISVSDGKKTAELPPFSISVTASVTSVTLTWTIPTVNTNGTAVNDLAGYHIYYGTSASSLNTVITVNNPGDTSQVIGNLTAGTWYFAVASFNSAKIDSALSAVLPVPIST